MPYLFASALLVVCYPFIAYSLVASRRKRKEKKQMGVVKI
jgi:hypothetical protein